MTRPDAAARTARLTAHRQQTARQKQQQALEAVAALQDAGTPISFAGVSRTAQVSTWFVYNNEVVRAAIEQAMRDQSRPSGPDTAVHPEGDDLSFAALRADLADAREEISTLRGERDKLRRRVQRVLGAEIDQLGHQEAIARIQELERQNRTLQAELVAARTEATDATRELATTQSDLIGARIALQRMIRERNTAAPVARDTNSS
ncbi:DUF6262 family protein [Citricoccus nitrophenolicus]